MTVPALLRLIWKEVMRELKEREKATGVPLARLMLKEVD